MKEKRLKGVIATLILGVASLAIAIFLGFLHWASTDVNQLVKNGAIYKVSSSDDVVVRIDYIYPEAIGELDSGNAIYLVGYVQPDGYLGYVGLETKESDKEVQKLIETSQDELSKNPQYLVVKAKSTYDKDSIINYENYLREAFASNEDVNQTLDYTSYVSRQNIGLGQVIYFAVPILTILGLFGLFYAWKLKKSNAKVYEELYLAYPDLQGNIQRMFDEANFKDDRIGVLIYKNHIYGYKQQIFLVDLRQVTNLYHHVINRKYYGVITVSRTSSLVFKRENEVKNKEYSIKNVGKNTDLQLQLLFDYVHVHFPNIRIGFEG